VETTIVQREAETTTAGRPGPGGSDSLSKSRSGRPKPGRSSGRTGQPEAKADSVGPGKSRTLIEALSQSKIYQDYERAFNEATGLLVSLRPVESWQLPFHGRKSENAFCAMMATKSRSCGVCLQVQQKLAESAQHGAQSLTCPVGFCDAAVPVRLGEQLVGFLQTGQVFRKPPTPAQFERTLKLLKRWGVQEDVEALRKAYYGARVLTPRQYDAVVKLLTIFAQHLAMVSNQVLVHQQHAEPPVITRAKEFIAEHQGEELSLGQVARAVNTSTFYFCKLFKRVSGINFTDYLSRVRIEKARNLLLNPSLRISEIAFEVGFQSLTHFNRVFKKIIGQSPTQFRAQLPT
jgi:AraC-like DNA-binding protein/ligand-binding sensor protein